MATIPFELKFMLKQHTPIIHFQHDQDGATLRATEVKPKLDRYIIEQLGGIHQTKKEWLSGDGKHPSLDYKLKFEITSNSEKFYFTSNPDSRQNATRQNLIYENFQASHINKTQYFANNENLKPNEIKESQNVKLGLLNENVFGIIICFNNELLEKINTFLIDFFLTTNFGCRQSKGFGCFTVIEKNKETINFDQINLINKFDVVYKIDQYFNSPTDAIQHISSIYKLLKSGRGAREFGGYKKSLLFRYFVSLPNPVRWEKRIIKQKIKDPYFRYSKTNRQLVDITLTGNNEPCYDLGQSKNWIDNPAPFQYKYTRALLGLAESFEFLAEDIEDLDERNNPTAIKFKYYISVKSNSGIDRFASPIIFKFINGNIYLCANTISNAIINTSNNSVSFNFDKKLKQGNKIKANTYFSVENFISNLSTPSTFNIGDFLDFAFNKDNEKINGVIKLKNRLIQ